MLMDAQQGVLEPWIESKRGGGGLHNQEICNWTMSQTGEAVPGSPQKSIRLLPCSQQ